MKRLLTEDLKRWKKSKRRKPLILQGVKQVGKTWLVKDFGQREYGDLAVYNFEDTPALTALFKRTLKPVHLLETLSALHGKKIEAGHTLIFFDEIQFCPEALTSLKYFCENAPEQHVICAGSLLGVTLAQAAYFPVGKVDFLTLRPLSFREYVCSSEEAGLEEVIAHPFPVEKLPEVLSQRFEALYRRYLVTGGMPGPVSAWNETRDFTVVGREQDAILMAYEHDFARHAPKNSLAKMHLIWESVPAQLAKESGKFVYGLLKSGARAREYEDAMAWLKTAGLIHRVSKIEKPAIPLSAYRAPHFFKIYAADVGLLRSMARLDPASVMTQDARFQEFKGALTENFVLQELLSLLPDVPHYWSSGNMAEVDFVVSLSGKLIPIEVKAADNSYSRSLGVYRQHYRPELSVKSSLAPLSYADGVLKLPLYLLSRLPEYAQGASVDERRLSGKSRSKGKTAP